MLGRSLVDSLFPADLPEPADWERRYPPRTLPDGAKVTRLGPSPTGPMHLGGLYTALICQDVARHSGGRYLVRVEDTDQAREVPGAREQFERAFRHFGLVPDESQAVGGDYGPYVQSERELIYLSYVRELLRHGHAYPCFATKDELAALAGNQRESKAPPGYYGCWAPWRCADEDAVRAALAAGRPYVVRFYSRSAPGERVWYADTLRGRVEFDANRNDVVILKSAQAGLRLPTYHLAHVVDDHLMRVNLVIRGDEWLSSVPVHLQLFAALGFEPVQYAHIAPLLKAAKGGKRKLSKRKDPEASVDYYERVGYPPEAIRYYLRGLANSRLADMPLGPSLAEPIDLARIGTSGALVDLQKLADISADLIAALPSETVLAAVRGWAGRFDPELAGVLSADTDLALRALRIERDNVPHPRKDLRAWSEFRTVYGYFFPQLFQPVTGLDGSLAGRDPAVVAGFARAFAQEYRAAADAREWLAWLRALAARHGFAASAAEYRAAPQAYHGIFKEAAQIIRVALTGSTRSPDLHAVATVLGPGPVCARVGALSHLADPARAADGDRRPEPSGRSH